MATSASEGMQESSAVELLTVCIRKTEPKFVVEEVERPIMVELCQREDIGNYWGIANTLYGLANLQMKLDNLEKAKDLLTEGLELTEQQNIHWVKIKIQAALGDLAFKNKEWEKAVHYYQLSFDSIEGFGDKTLLHATQEKFQEASKRIQGKGLKS